MRTSNTILIHGDRDRIYELAANIQDWPALLPHYHYVRVEEESSAHRIAWMGASRDGFPVRWRCRQELLPSERRIVFQHIAGITRGRDVEWRVVHKPRGQPVRVATSRR